ncbi:putative uncharacterized protein [Bacillus altitudinis]|nr:putative uncharacterized protein [Bacillus pumilus]SPR92140.1 hypothetical protein PAE4_10589 [Bacillus altitudinis]
MTVTSNKFYDENDSAHYHSKKQKETNETIGYLDKGAFPCIQYYFMRLKNPHHSQGQKA